MMFKKIVAEIANGTDINEICGMINKAFEDEKISWKDHELLFNLISRIDNEF